MSRAIPYDATKRALFQLDAAEDVFLHGEYQSEEAICAEMSRAAYLGDSARLNRALDRTNFSLEHAFKHRSTFAFLARCQRSGTLVLAFRGTTPDPHDILTDIRFLPQKWATGGSVHRGFADALDTIWGTITAQIPSSDARLLMTGHSLGGALALLAASRLRPSKLFTFGSPSVGDEKFAKTVAEVPHDRFHNCSDLVCRLPLALLGFVHAGAAHYIDSRGEIHSDPKDDFIVSDQRSASANYLARFAWRPGTCALRELADHAPINYLSAILRRRGRTVRLS